MNEEIMVKPKKISKKDKVIMNGIESRCPNCKSYNTIERLHVRYAPLPMFWTCNNCCCGWTNSNQRWKIKKLKK